MFANDDLFTLAYFSLTLWRDGIETTSAGITGNSYHGQAVTVIFADLFVSTQ
jgi:hypothetical protein